MIRFDGTLIQDVIVQVVRADAPTREPGRLATPGLVRTTLTTTTTNTTESYRFLNLRPGEYKVRIHVPDEQVEYHQGEVLRVEPEKMSPPISGSLRSAKAAGVVTPRLTACRATA